MDATVVKSPRPGHGKDIRGIARGRHASLAHMAHMAHTAMLMAPPAMPDCRLAAYYRVCDSLTFQVRLRLARQYRAPGC